MEAVSSLSSLFLFFHQIYFGPAHPADILKHDVPFGSNEVLQEPARSLVVIFITFIFIGQLKSDTLAQPLVKK